MALRLQLWLDLPLSIANLRLRANGGQFWHVLSAEQKHTEVAILRAAAKGQQPSSSISRKQPFKRLVLGVKQTSPFGESGHS